MKIYYINRKNGEKKIEKVLGGNYLSWIYDSSVGNFLLETILKRKIASTIYGKIQDSKKSAKKIPQFVSEYNINMSEALRENPSEYNSFNDFFTRKLKSSSRPIDSSMNNLISPSDGKILAYENINQNSIFQVKGSTFSLNDLLLDDSLSEKYYGGTFVVVRLCPTDYHRYHFLDNCIVKSYRELTGDYYSVSPIALYKKDKIYCKNKRNISELSTENFGNVVFLEIGATFVGTIISKYSVGCSYKKGSEMGYFKFGGSTVAFLFEKNKVSIDSDIIKNSLNFLETQVFMGEKIGGIYK